MWAKENYYFELSETRETFQEGINCKVLYRYIVKVLIYVWSQKCTKMA